MADEYLKPYLDSSVFIAWLRGEPGRHHIAAHILEDAQKGTHPIIISALTFAEVHKVKGDGKPHLTPAENEKVLDYFEHDFFRVVDVDRVIGEEANRFCRTYNIKPNDAIHLACALRAKCDVLLFWDRPFIAAVKHNAIRIEEPQITSAQQLTLLPPSTGKVEDAAPASQLLKPLDNEPPQPTE
ncbi:MAG: type II toxin-antitoxin system VapC family toxin [Acidobacteriota bacterium]